MVNAIVLRYVGTLTQFVLLAIIARSLTPDEYGVYLLCLSVTFSFYYIVGFGASEAAVARLPRLREAESNVETSEITASVMMLTGISVAILLGLIPFSRLFEMRDETAWTAFDFTCLFLAANGIIFNVAQLLLGQGKTTLGSFFFYPAINLTLLLSVVPFLLLSDRVTFESLTQVSAFGAFVTAGIGSVICLSGTGRRGWRPFKQARSLLFPGIGMLAVRIMHVSSFWIPTMITGFLISSADAGQIGTAGRLAIAVSAVIAALRFVARPTLTVHLARDTMPELKRFTGSIAFVTTTMGIVSLAVHLLIGDELIRFVFGPEFNAVAPLLTILLLSVIAEAIFGPVDEILKLSGNQAAVTWIYGIGVLLFLVGAILTVRQGLHWVAWFQVLYVAGVFTAMNLLVKRKFGYFVLPCWPDRRLLAGVR